MSFNNVLEDLKSRLATIPTIKSVKLGLEANMTPQDYPAIRIVIDSLSKSDIGTRKATLLVYAGLPLVEGTTQLETILTSLLAIEDKIIEVTRQGEDFRSTYIKTLMSGAEVQHYQLICVMLEVSWML